MTSLLMTFIIYSSLRYGNRDSLSGHTGVEICHFKLLNYRYLTLMWWERTQFSNSTFWRLVFSHSCFRIHLQLDFVSLEMNYSWFIVHYKLDISGDDKVTVVSSAKLRILLFRGIAYIIDIDQETDRSQD